MDVEAVRNGIVTTVHAGVAALNKRGLAYAPDDGDPDLFYVMRALPAYDVANARGLDQLNITLRVLVGGADEVQAQRRLDRYLAGSGDYSIKAALVADKTLAGSCRTSIARAWSNYGRHQLGSNEYWGADLSIDAYGGN